MRHRIFLHYFIPGALGAFILFTGCRQNYASNDPRTQGQAQARMEQVLEASARMSEKLQRARKELRAVEIFLGDIASLIQKEQPGSENGSSESQKNVMGLFRKLLLEATQSLVDLSEDGSWALQKNFPVPLPINATDGGEGCGLTKVVIRGESIEGGKISIFAEACALEQPLLLGQITGRTEQGSMLVRFFPENIDRLAIAPGESLPSGDGSSTGVPATFPARVPECVVRVFEVKSQVTCQPFKLKQFQKNSSFLDISKLEYTTEEDGRDFLSIDNQTDVEIFGAIHDNNGPATLSFEFKKHPGSRIQIQVRQAEGPRP